MLARLKNPTALFAVVAAVLFVLSLLQVERLQQQLYACRTRPVARWQFPSHRDPQAQTYYLASRQFFFEDLARLRGEKRAVAQCYWAHCTEEGSRATGNFENVSVSRQKGCSNYDYQDVSVYSAFFQEPQPRRYGVFVEIGAMTGWGASNTYFFEHCLNWSGVLFEAAPDNYAQLVRNRGGGATRTLFGTVCEPAGQVYVARDTAGCCGRVSSRPELARDPQYVAVPCKPMAQWLREVGITRVDYFSLDTEGYEWEVLRTIDWSALSVRVLSVEMLERELAAPDEFANQAKIRALLARVGLTYLPWLSIARDSLNRDEFWVNLSWTVDGE